MRSNEPFVGFSEFDSEVKRACRTGDVGLLDSCVRRGWRCWNFEVRTQLWGSDYPTRGDDLSLVGSLRYVLHQRPFTQGHVDVVRRWIGQNKPDVACLAAAAGCSAALLQVFAPTFPNACRLLAAVWANDLPAVKAALPSVRHSLGDIGLLSAAAGSGHLAIVRWAMQDIGLGPTSSAVFAACHHNGPATTILPILQEMSPLPQVAVREALVSVVARGRTPGLVPVLVFLLRAWDKTQVRNELMATAKRSGDHVAYACTFFKTRPRVPACCPPNISLTSSLSPLQTLLLLLLQTGALQSASRPLLLLRQAYRYGSDWMR